MGVHDDVVLVVPTLQNYGNLAGIVAAITPEVTGTDALVLVANHDGGRDTPRLVAHLTATVGVRALCFTVPEPGASAARNALIRAATTERPGWQWIVMLDDEVVIHDGWLASMLEAGARCDADLVIRSSTTGAESATRAHHEIAIRRAILDSIGDPWFAVGPDGADGADDGYADAAFVRAVLDHGGRLSRA